MISLTSAQLEAWIAAFIYPLSRILAFIATAPLWSSTAIPRRIRLVLGLVLTIALAPMLPAPPAVNPASGQGLAILAQQMLIGIGMGFAAKIVYSAIDVTGEYIGSQMGLGFATFYDPIHSSQTPVIAEYINLVAMLLFLSFNGHLIYVATLARSFSALPIGTHFLAEASWLNLVELGKILFASGLLLALPVIVAVMIGNLALAVLARAAPQLNIISIGFPITLLGGFVAMGVSLSYLPSPLQMLFEQALSAMLDFALPVQTGLH